VIVDPDAALANARSATAAVIAILDAIPDDVTPLDVDLATRANALAEAFDALDTWLSRQGFLPGAWARGR
jgi:hypothetical protein